MKKEIHKPPHQKKNRHFVFCRVHQSRDPLCGPLCSGSVLCCTDTLHMFGAHGIRREGKSPAAVLIAVRVSPLKLNVARAGSHNGTSGGIGRGSPTSMRPVLLSRPDIFTQASRALGKQRTRMHNLRRGRLADRKRRLAQGVHDTTLDRVDGRPSCKAQAINCKAPTAIHERDRI